MKRRLSLNQVKRPSDNSSGVLASDGVDDKVHNLSGDGFLREVEIRISNRSDIAEVCNGDGQDVMK